MSGWTRIIGRYKNYWNFLGVDIQNGKDGMGACMYVCMYVRMHTCLYLSIYLPTYLLFFFFKECGEGCAWGSGSMDNDFELFVERFIVRISKDIPDFKGLFFVGGGWKDVDSTNRSPYAYTYGGNDIHTFIHQ